MSFSLTTEQVRAGLKTVTRRSQWQALKPGTKLLAVEKAMGLKAGEKVKPIRPIRVVSVRRERFDEIVNADRPGYGAEEMTREGFPGRDPQDFLFWYLALYPHVEPDGMITRIEFEYL